MFIDWLIEDTISKDIYPAIKDTAFYNATRIKCNNSRHLTGKDKFLHSFYLQAIAISSLWIIFIGV